MFKNHLLKNYNAANFEITMESSYNGVDSNSTPGLILGLTSSYFYRNIQENYFKMLILVNHILVCFVTNEY